MHDLAVDRFFTHRMINGNQTKPDGPIKTFPLRGIKESPPYFHDGRLLTLEDTIEFFNLVLGVRLSAGERATCWPSCACCDAAALRSAPRRAGCRGVRRHGRGAAAIGTGPVQKHPTGLI